MHEVLTCQMFTHHVFNTQCQHMKLWHMSYWQVLTHCVFQHTVSTYKVMMHQYWHAKRYHTVYSVSQIQNADASSTDTLSVKQHVINTYSVTISSDDIILNVNTSCADNWRGYLQNWTALTLSSSKEAPAEMTMAWQNIIIIISICIIPAASEIIFSHQSHNHHWNVYGTSKQFDNTNESHKWLKCQSIQHTKRTFHIHRMCSNSHTYLPKTVRLQAKIVLQHQGRECCVKAVIYFQAWPYDTTELSMSLTDVL